MVLGLTVLGSALRLVVTRSIWLDEAISIGQAQMSFRTMIATIARQDVHPPLHHILLWVTMRLFGDGALAVRAPSIVAGALLIPMLYVAGQEFYSREVGLVAAGLGTVAPIAIWYSQEARMYSTFMLFALVAVWAQVRLLRDGRAVSWALYLMATAALVWNQYFAVLQVLVQQIVFAIAVWDRRGRDRQASHLLAQWIIATFVLIALISPLVSILQSQLHAFLNQGDAALPQQVGLGVARSHTEQRLSVYAVLANAIWALLGYHANSTMAQIVALWPLGMLLLLILLGRGWSRISLVLLAVAVVPALALFGIGLARRNLFELRYFIGAVPVGLLLAARCATASRNRVGRSIMAMALLATLVVGLADQQFNGDNPRLYDFRGALEQIAAEANASDVLIFEPTFIGPVVDYYVPHMRAQALHDGLPSRQRARRIYLLGSFLDDPVNSARIGEALHRLGRSRRQLREIQQPNVWVWVFQ
jgi:uncharacterized membrane protein